MKSPKNNTQEPVKRIFACPQCGKRRLKLPADFDGDLSSKSNYQTYSGGEVELHDHVCTFCQAKNQQKYFSPSEKDLKKLMKALQEGHAEESLEDML